MNIHYMNAENEVRAVIDEYEKAMYLSSYEAELLIRLKTAINEMQIAVGALPIYNLD